MTSILVNYLARAGSYDYKQTLHEVSYGNVMGVEVRSTNRLSF
jgi:hypothetical protein